MKRIGSAQGVSGPQLCRTEKLGKAQWQQLAPLEHLGELVAQSQVVALVRANHALEHHERRDCHRDCRIVQALPDDVAEVRVVAP